MTKKKTTFLGIQIPDNISKALTEDAKIHYRTKSQHIIWIVDRYFLELSNTIYSEDNIKSYSAEDIKEMKDNYYKNKEGK